MRRVDSRPGASTFTPFLVLALLLQRALELRHARANEAWAREHGAVEHGRTHYPLFFLLHGAWMASLFLEGRRNPGKVRWGWLLLLLALQPLRYWVIRLLGRHWNTRILILPGGKRVPHGPFRFVKHPNYAVVALELLSAPLGVGAWRTALAFGILNAALLLGVRIPAEERALRGYENENESGERS